MTKKKVDEEPKKVLITLETYARPARCCECIFGGECSYDALIDLGLDCDKYDLSDIKIVKIENKE